MIQGEIIYTRNIEEFAVEISNIIIRTADLCISNKGHCCIAVSGGTTPLPVFELLATKYYKNILNWSNVHIYFIDERCVPKDHPDNNFKSCYDVWLKYAQEIQCHPIESWLAPNDAAQKYEEEITSFLDKKNGLPEFDLLFMGIGEDGHIASLFPDYDFTKDNNYCVEDVYIQSKSMHRVTMTLPILNNAKNRIIGIVGKKKKKIFNDLMNYDFKDYPAAQLLSSNAKDTWVIS